mmetsp:Transcript_56478/g.148898  ORF Transcript_56478/g.148898 Transcript_56478/m.148898 type:complete len:125 (+) Transcript_56478:163-537(+)
MEAAAACVRRHGRTVEGALQFVKEGPDAQERRADEGSVFAGRMFQRYLKANTYFLGDDWPRSVLRFPSRAQQQVSVAFAFRGGGRRRGRRTSGRATRRGCAAASNAPSTPPSSSGPRGRCPAGW